MEDESGCNIGALALRNRSSACVRVHPLAMACLPRRMKEKKLGRVFVDGWFFSFPVSRRFRMSIKDLCRVGYTKYSTYVDKVRFKV